MHKIKEFVEGNGWILSYSILYAIAIFSIAIFLDLTDAGFWISLLFINLIKECGEFKALTEILEKNNEEIKEASKSVGFIFKHLYLGLVIVYFIALTIFPTGFLSKAALEGMIITEGQFYLSLCLLGLPMDYVVYKMTMEKENFIKQETKIMQSEKMSGLIVEDNVSQVYKTIKAQFTEQAADCAKKMVSIEEKFEKTAKKTSYPLIFECLEETKETILYFPDFPEFITVVKSTKKEDILYNARNVLPEYIKEYKINNIILPWASDIESVKKLTGSNNVVMISSTGGNDE